MSGTPDAAIELLPYDPAWPEKFAFERGVLLPILAPWLAGPIEHVGSTAVPGLVAKPIIDIMVPVESLEISRGIIPAITAAGYSYYPYKAEIMHWFCKPSPAHRTHHVHAVPFGGPLWHERLAFRDALRGDPRLAARYGDLKIALAEQFRHDRDGYTQAKTGFVEGVLRGIPIRVTR